MKTLANFSGDTTPFADNWRMQAWSFEATSIYIAGLGVANENQDGADTLSIYLDSASPFIAVDTTTYAKMIDAIQVKNASYWQCADYNASLTNYNSTSGKVSRFAVDKWWASCISQYSCAIWDALPPMTIELLDDLGELELRTYSYFLNTTYYKNLTSFWTNSTNADSVAPIANETIPSNLIPSTCQMMVTWNDDLQPGEVVMGIPFFRQFAVVADF